jgi:uroporphyrinogen-III synthase
VTPKTIFISRSRDQIGSALRQFEANGGVLYAQSLITFEGIKMDEVSSCEVVFFSSIRAASFFFQHHQKPKALFACAGGETARKLADQFQIACAFIADEAGNPSKSAIAFKHWLQERTVLFPMSEQSLHSYSSLIPSPQKTELYVYRTLTNPMVISPCDYYVFSSPSNVRAFLEVNVLPIHARCIAWGQSTEAALIALQIPVHYCLKEGSVIELDAYLKEHVFQTIDE